MIDFRYFIASLMLPLLLLSAPLVAHGETPALSLEKNYAAAHAKIQTGNRLLFVMFEKNDCEHCQKFTEKVLDAPVFRQFAKNHLALLFYNFGDLESLPKSEQIVAGQFVINFDIDTTPTILVFDPDGKQVLKTKGYRGTSAEKIVKQLTEKLPAKP
jgi:thioredoxin-related protein